jgi:hypothetical protein
VIFAGAESASLEELSRIQTEKAEVVRWRFTATVREQMDYTRYPLDAGSLRLRLVHKELDHNVVLVPDLDSYAILTPSLRPGLAADAFLPGWTIRESSFSLERARRLNSFGEARAVNHVAFPTLSFDIRLRRDFINAFISNLTPLIIVSLMLYILLLVAERVDIGRFMSICVGMFFVVTFSHLDSRHLLSVQGLLYLECYYLVIYAFLLGVTVLSIMVQTKEHFPRVARDNSLVAKLLYWPVLFGALF